jgi:two-component system nitrogen regulation sensor histidine kinase NtrY
VLLLLIPCLALTAYYARYGMTGRIQPDSIIPSPSYALVLFLVYLDSVGLVVLTLLLSRKLIKAYFEKRHRLLGSGFRAKLIAAFIGFALIPTVLLATLASGVISDVSVVWFNDLIMQVMKDSEDVTTVYHQERVALAVNSARAISQEIFREPGILNPEHRELLMAAMERKRTEYNLAGVEVFSPKMETLARMVHPELTDAVLSLPVGQLVLQVLDTGEALTSVQESTAGMLIRAAMPISPRRNNETVQGVVVVSSYVSESMLAKMESIAKNFSDYRQIKAMKDPIKWGAYLFVAIVTILILFGATWFGFYVARGITVPIQRLAEGTEAVAKGDLNVKIAVEATDEIGTLVTSFNRMTADLRQSKTRLEEANQSLVQSNVEIDQRRAYTEAVVETIVSGVLSIDVAGMITTFNPSAERILGVSGEHLRGRLVFEAFKEYDLQLFQQAYDRVLADGRDSLSLEGQMEAHGMLLTIGLNVSRMCNDAGKDLGFVFVFEDRTELIKAQKAEAWQEVAQRIAHEIKNPLTPIQLSAQRLRKKFFEKSAGFEEIFDQSTGVIVSEVSSLKRMVDEFSKFARMPAPRMNRVSLDDLVEKVVSLYDGAHRDVEFVLNLDEPLPPINCDSDQIRRVFVNLFDNAIQAMDQRGHIWVTSKYDPRRHRAIVRVADEGTGILPEDQEKLFIPYFSKKRSGTGLGLAIVQRIITDHNGSIRVENNTPRGAVFTFELPV